MTNEAPRYTLRAYLGEIARGVAEHVSTADLWGMVRQSAEAQGHGAPTGGLPLMNQLRAGFAGIERAKAAFDRALPQQTIEGSMIAPDVVTSQRPGMTVTPMYRVRYLQTVESLTGQTVTAYRTTTFPVQLPGTKAELLAELEADAISSAETYGERHLGLADVSLTVV